MIDLYIHTAQALSHTFYGIPYFLFNVVLSLAFTFLVVLPFGKVSQSGRFQHVSTNNAVFAKLVGFPLLIGVLLTYGITLISLLSVFNKIFDLGWF
ncbi:hypothetical protein HCH43_25005 [Klebsiella pneumoniae]|uniref:hypothetical protein n=1 Tax=Klebsiella pneumoniae TaxID=573 RepID=UPI001C8CDE5E|nr:hypothetical protein [Klebsiella pneumoniae]MBX8866399.1 hypothetical protein [Klebsiella pneumoniae]